MGSYGDKLQNTEVWDDYIASLLGQCQLMCVVLMLFVIVSHCTIAQVWTINLMVTLTRWDGSGAYIFIWGRESWKKDRI